MLLLIHYLSPTCSWGYISQALIFHQVMAPASHQQCRALSHSQPHTDRHTHTYTHTHRYTLTHRYTHTHTHTHGHTDMHTHRYTHSHTQTRTHTDTYTHTHTHTHTDTQTCTHTDTHTHTHRQAHTQIHTHTHTRTCTLLRKGEATSMFIWACWEVGTATSPMIQKQSDKGNKKEITANQPICSNSPTPDLPL